MLDPDLLAFARKLRREHTEPERYLWSLLRNRRLADAKFRRQHPVAPYVLDFYCHEARLAVELDGGQHHVELGRIKDERRTQFLNERGIRVLRFWNHEVFEDVEVVVDAIVRALDEARETLTRPLRGRPLPRGEVDITFLLPRGEGARRADEGIAEKGS